MTKSELVSAIADKAGISKANAEKALKAFTGTVTDELASGGKVEITGFGTFSAVDKAERQGRNPATGEAITVAARTAPKFKAGKTLKEAVN